MLTLRCLAAAALVLTSVSCKSLSSTRTGSGQPLEVRGHIDHINTYVTDDLDIVKEHDNYVFDGFYEGETKIDDELDYFHVAGDADNEKRVTEWRKAWNLEVMTGWGANGVGALLIAGGIGYVALQSGGNFDNLDFNAPDAQIGFGVATAGGILIGASFLLASSIGPDKPLNRFELVLDPRDEATAAADEYNRKVRGEPPVEAEPAAEPEVAPGDG